jgi:flagellar assembly factor FliW
MPERRMFVLDAAVYLPGYTPYLNDYECEVLDLHRPEDAMVLVVSNTSEGKPTVNLLAPIVVNTTTARCSQVILEGQNFPIKSELAAPAA